MPVAIKVMIVLLVAAGLLLPGAPARAFPPTELDERINAGLSHFRASQREDGGWSGRMGTSSVIHNCELIFLYESLGLLSEKAPIVTGLLSHLWSQQHADGYFSAYSDGPPHEDISLMAYLAAKIAGEDELSERMLRLERFINDRRAVEKALGAKPVMIYFRLLEPPPLPPGILKLTLALDEHWPWTKVAAYPYLYLFAARRWHPLLDSQVPKRIGLRSLPGETPVSPAGEADFFDWLLNNIGESGALFDYTISAVPGLMALAAAPGQEALLARGVRTLESYLIPEPTGLRQALGLADVGEAAVLLLAFLDLDLPPEDPMARKAEEFLWRYRDARTGGFAFTSQNRNFPDSDMTGTTLGILRRSALRRGESAASFDDRVVHGIDWLLGLQNNDGGFGTWEPESALFGAVKALIPDMRRLEEAGFLFSESVPEHTARIVRALGAFRGTYPSLAAAHEKGIAYILSQQRPDGSFPGFWLVNYIPGTGNALMALATKADDPDVRASIDRGIDFLLSRQREDGGFSESPASFAAKEAVALPRSSPSQTALALLSLMTAAKDLGADYWQRMRPAVEKGVSFLLATQQPDGLWRDPTLTATVLPNYEYLIYPNFQEILPLHALGLYRGLVGRGAERAARSLVD